MTCRLESIRGGSATAVLVVVLLSGCRSFDPAILEAEQVNRGDLPGLDRIVVERIWHEPIGSAFASPATKAADSQLEQDAIRLIENSFARVFVGRKTKGRADIHFRLSRRTNSAWVLLSYSTFAVLNIVGMPLSSDTVQVEIMVTLANADAEVVSQYRGKGKTTAYWALYWGYNGRGSFTGRVSDTARVANARATEEAVDAIRDEMARDSAKIAEGLGSASSR